MPLPALKSLASKAGTTLPKAEKAWEKAKAQRAKDTGKKEKAFTDRDWTYVMGVTKRIIGLPTKSVEGLAEELINCLINEAGPTSLPVTNLATAKRKLDVAGIPYIVRGPGRLSLRNASDKKKALRILRE